MQRAKSAVSGFKRKNLPGSKHGHGNRGEFWNVRVPRCWDAARLMLLCADGTQGLLLVVLRIPEVHPHMQAWIFSVTAPVNCPVRYYLLNIYCLFPVHVW